MEKSVNIMEETDTNKRDVSTPKKNSDKSRLVEIRNGKPVIKQKILSFEKMSETMQEIVKFREMIEEKVQKKEPVADIPEEYRPLIAKLVHESDKTLLALSRYIHQELIPAQDEDDEETCKNVSTILPVEVIEKAVKSVAVRNNYGLEAPPSGGKVSNGWLIWRWEVKDDYRDRLPKAAKEKVELRLAERRQAKEDIKTLFLALPEKDRSAVISTKSNSKVSGNDKVNKKHVFDVIVLDSDDSPKPPPQSNKQRENRTPEGSKDEPQDGSAKIAPGRSKKVTDPEKLAKEKEKQEKKIAKLEKEKKEKEAQNKSRSLMANFFGKAKAPAPSRSSSITKDTSASVAGPSTPMRSDFEKTFRPFLVKKDAELAPTNWFRNNRHRKMAKNLDGKTVIVLDEEEEMHDDDIQMQDVQAIPNLGQRTAQERLHDSIAALSSRASSSYLKCNTGFKSYHPHPVRTLLSQLNEAEIAGDDQAVRSILALLRNRTLIPAKALIFTEDARPGYFGTWTRNSREVGPRTPFARDVVALDYTCDSGEEWEEESGDADDVIEDAEEEDANDEPDSDLDSWLVDDDEVEEPGTPIEDRDGSPGMIPSLDLPAPLPPKRKAKDAGDGEGAARSNKRKKMVVQLVPFTKGPCWESHIGKCEYDPFNAYRIQLFNDTPYPIDPFTFVSTLVDEKPTEKPAKAPGTSAPSDDGFAVPALPDRILNFTGSNLPMATPKRSTLAPKTTFPEVHLPLLVSKITSLETGSISYIVETVFQELKAHKIKKNAIEAKVKEIGEKSKDGRKIWIVKSDMKGMNVSS